MALKKTVNTTFGVEIPDAYHRVEQVTLVGKDKISFRLRSYKSAESQVSFSDAGYECAYTLEGKNPIAQAYEFLKSLEEYEEFVDC